MYLVRDLVSPRTWLAFIHHFIGVLVGAAVVWIVVPGLVVGTLGLPVAMIGMPVLGATLRFTDWFARAERTRFAVTLGEQVPVWPAGTRSWTAGQCTKRRPCSWRWPACSCCWPRHK